MKRHHPIVHRSIEDSAEAHLAVHQDDVEGRMRQFFESLPAICDHMSLKPEPLDHPERHLLVNRVVLDQ